MQSAKFAILVLVGLCATQTLSANPFSDLPDSIQEIIDRVREVIQQFQKQISKLISDIRHNLNNIPKCMESERPKITAMVNEVEQGAMQCITEAMNDIQPVSEKIAKTISELIPLAQKVVPELTKCAADQNPITLAICVTRVVVPTYGQVTQIMNEVREEIPEVEKVVQEKIMPLVEKCSAEAEKEVAKVRAIVAEMENCVSNNQS